jgi:hypothetical protein
MTRRPLTKSTRREEKEGPEKGKKTAKESASPTVSVIYQLS